MNKTYSTIDEYIKSYPQDIQTLLQKIRQTIKQTVPESTESISYNMPAFEIDGKVLVYFAAFKHHIGFYALPSGNIAFKKELTKYKTGKGSIQFPLNEPMPYDLIRKIVLFRVEESKNS